MNLPDKEKIANSFESFDRSERIAAIFSMTNYEAKITPAITALESERDFLKSENATLKQQLADLQSNAAADALDIKVESDEIVRLRERAEELEGVLKGVYNNIVDFKNTGLGLLWINKIREVMKRVK